MKFRHIFLILFLSLSMSSMSYAEKKKKDDAKTLSGISIIGNKDAPKSLYIVPWRSSELGIESDLNSSLLNEGMHPVDKDVFVRELNFYEISTVK
ncbi:MAG: hypothetical protein OQK75_11145 [Gammaproteobacteria bacterium]|nr:hypothetical protein [Gammaproteobacteria bacterium]MCW8988208.1 hypothetical protein [Gammaproteobacteria bacterium]